MVIAWAIATQLLGRAIDERLQGQLDNATAILADGTFPFTPDLIGRLDRLIEARIALLDDRGTIGISTGPPALDNAISGRALDQYHAAQSATLVADGDEWRIAVRPLLADRDDRYDYVIAAAPLRQTNTATRSAALLLGAAMLLAAIVLAWIGSYFTRSITRPVEELSRFAHRIAGGERAVRSAIDEDNEIGTLARSLNDMAERLAEYERELAETNRRIGLGNLAARMAHEVRNPLTAMKMQLQLLEEKSGADEAARVRSVLAEVRRLELIVDSALALGGGETLNPAPTDIGALITELAELLEPSLSHRGITLDTELGALPAVPADGARLKQVLLNLVNNAAEAAGRGGRIGIRAGLTAGDALEIVVEDSGPGLPATDDDRPGKPLGLGLGLKISREIVERHGGTLEAGSSERLGGAQFTLRLPVSIMATNASGGA